MDLVAARLLLDDLLREHFSPLGQNPRTVTVSFSHPGVAKEFETGLNWTMSGLRRLPAVLTEKPLPQLFAQVRDAIRDLESTLSGPESAGALAAFLRSTWLQKIKADHLDDWFHYSTGPEETYDLTLILAAYDSNWLRPIRELPTSDIGSNIDEAAESDSGETGHDIIFTPDGVTVRGTHYPISNSSLRDLLNLLYSESPRHFPPEELRRRGFPENVCRLVGGAVRNKVPVPLRGYVRGQAGVGFWWADSATAPNG
jgi:hypothetical protein